MTSLLRTLALAAVAAGVMAFVNTPEAKAQRLIYTNYYAAPYYAGTAVTLRRPILGPRTAFYAPAYGVAPVYTAPTVVGYPATTSYYAPTTTYYAPTTTYYGGTVVGPTVTNYPGTTVYYGGTVAPLAVPAVSYPLPSVVYPPAVFP